MNDTQLEEAVKLAAEKKLVICDGMTLYHMPIFKKLKEIVDSGKLEIGQDDSGKLWKL